MEQQEVLHIIKRIKKGDKDAFALLIDAHKNMVYSLCLKMTRSAEDAEEIAQDSFIKAYQGIHTFKQKAKFSTWLYQITYFTAINFLRKNTISTTTDYPEDLIESDETIISSIQQSEREHYINKALSFLEPTERAIITLFYLEEHSIKEISEITTLTESNVKVKIHRTRKKIYSILNKLLKNELNTLV